MAHLSQNIEIDFYFISRHITIGRELFRKAQDLHYESNEPGDLQERCAKADLLKASRELQDAAALLRLLAKR